jgi:uncharacterized membrane protein
MAVVACLKKYAVLAVKPQPRFWLLACGIGAVAVLFFSTVVNHGSQKMTPRRALTYNINHTTSCFHYALGARRSINIKRYEINFECLFTNTFDRF